MTKQAMTISSVLERFPWLDRVAEPLQEGANGLLNAGAATRRVKDWLNGTPLRHRIHPAMIIMPLGAWTMAGLLDLFDALEGDRRWSDSADLLVGTGIVTALPTAATGLADWVDLGGQQRRVGMAHALLNSAALSLYIASFALRRAGQRNAARATGGLGFGLVMLGGMLGGELVYNLGANVTHLLYPKPPDEYTDACASAELAEGQVRVVEVGRVPVMLRRYRGEIQAVEAWCPHAGGPLNEGEFEGDVVTCPWHGSRFCLSDGAPLQGPASAPLRTFAVREDGGRILVRPSDETRSWPSAPEPPPPTTTTAVGVPPAVPVA